MLNRRVLAQAEYSRLYRLKRQVGFLTVLYALFLTPMLIIAPATLIDDPKTCGVTKVVVFWNGICLLGFASLFTAIRMHKDKDQVPFVGLLRIWLSFQLLMCSIQAVVSAFLMGEFLELFGGTEGHVNNNDDALIKNSFTTANKNCTLKLTPRTTNRLWVTTVVEPAS